MSKVVHVLNRIPADRTRKKVNYVVTARRMYHSASDLLKLNFIELILAIVATIVGIVGIWFQSVATGLLERPLFLSDHVAGIITQLAVYGCTIGVMTLSGLLIRRKFFL